MTYELVVYTRSLELDEAKLLAMAARRQKSVVQDRIRHMADPPLAPLTVAAKGSSQPLRDTGVLMSSIATAVAGHRAVIGTNRRGARINNEGGTIRPRRARKLWIPADRWARRKVRAHGGSIARTIEALRKAGSCWISRSGKAFLHRPDGGVTRVVFVLKDEVRIPARPFMFFSTEDAERIALTVAGAVDGRR